VINDLEPPEISVSHSPTTVYETDIVQVTAQITDDSSMSEVILSYSSNGGSSWANVSMSPDSTDWVGDIPPMSVGTSVMYKVYATDILGNSAVSSIGTYSVDETPETTTTTTSTIPTTTPTETTSESSSTTTSSQMSTNMGDGTPMVLAIGAAAGIAVVIVLVVVIKKKR
ncbi:MAG: hypothetical protein ACFFF4_18895, partial [Candidatus Thorarchaeota archaeon]